eukprot:MONOS_2804.1-p1 / transcript=MONOS_2804.1 / gene=MONOS_2804 / organism=Monocercomonoides_exilis_PA203 / gene_product=dna damage-inducible v-snare binding protein / transcript_product=dna damage-inducible v-snare binding protein / location=Mono_scaffold00060:80159-83002(-) / protein_length=726 / sequence_SO=supercontig / SO=protein_coding / is_pseudo=false
MALSVPIVARINETGLKLLYRLRLEVTAGELRTLIADDLFTDRENVVLVHKGKSLVDNVILNGNDGILQSAWSSFKEKRPHQTGTTFNRLPDLPVGTDIKYPKLKDGELLMQSYSMDQRVRDLLRIQTPLLADAIETGSLELVNKILLERFRTEMKAYIVHKHKEKYVTIFPYAPDAKEELSKAQKKFAVEGNWKKALQLLPDSFHVQTSLFCAGFINDVRVAILIDSGAARTFITLQCAIKCGLEDVIDQTIHGTAVGVGTGVIMGYIHSVDLMIEGMLVSTPMFVLEGGVFDVSLGVDNLRKFRCKIDLIDNSMTIGPYKCNFLTEDELRHFDDVSHPQPSASSQEDLFNTTLPPFLSILSQKTTKNGSTFHQDDEAPTPLLSSSFASTSSTSSISSQTASPPAELSIQDKPTESPSSPSYPAIVIHPPKNAAPAQPSPLRQAAGNDNASVASDSSDASSLCQAPSIASDITVMSDHLSDCDVSHPQHKKRLPSASSYAQPQTAPKIVASSQPQRAKNPYPPINPATHRGVHSGSGHRRLLLPLNLPGSAGSPRIAVPRALKPRSLGDAHSHSHSHPHSHSHSRPHHAHSPSSALRPSSYHVPPHAASPVSASPPKDYPRSDRHHRHHHNRSDPEESPLLSPVPSPLVPPSPSPPHIRTTTSLLANSSLKDASSSFSVSSSPYQSSPFVETLTEMGFGKREAIYALHQSRGNLEKTIHLLTQML